jgi:hypothetical protein
MPISALEARARINETVTVEMPVKAAKSCQRCLLIEEKKPLTPLRLAVYSNLLSTQQT